ncbi:MULTISPECIES: ABC transporter permease [Clostridium]|uniref:Integral membrane protein (Permease) n=1 Tax=Clostridium acetobutylicum (strain ATCC 824 / DSM 792 / JCM 1419 / IAM 19013 / LMG 5710 / NBRC 13948 / NRRL B-527 / VKM B-1787 / 2291 / W) TaxID=272562 RepID=Q97MF4_CLOAB|nr:MULTISPECIES: ABC transporter permease [Clostridium]AAK78225.1 Integral membrane protein (permease) [Clostridium acetobutylicum ATCC 824]ADZ19291.1 Integral membrane protein (permease) [Clostridium acetobutylicum EA 2018]AEI33385.1 permease [Clostridium acetobutylicum DSM 1731]AWV82033.1 ABC transporter permease [Clostridium acetobutylicum]MBC2396079.1 ABC transporter permease [Clostridium acetobutylicum]
MLEFRIASKFLRSSKGQTILIILGIAIGVSVQVFIGTLIQGLQKSLVDKTIGSSPQITVTSEDNDGSIDRWEDKIKSIKNSNSKVENVSASTDFSAFIDKNNKTYPVLIRGFEFANADKIYKIKDNIKIGREPKDENEVLIGIDLKKDASLKVGDKITIFTPKGVQKEVKITGVYDLKSSSINDKWILTTLKTSQDMFNYGDKVTAIEMQVKDVFNADVISKDVKSSLNLNDVKISNWKDSNASLLSGLSGQSASSIMIQVFVLVSVVLGITSVLAITVMQKSKQIGILKAMGIKDSAASRIFLFEGLILGIFGAVIGVALGLGWTYSFTKFAVNPDGTPVVPLYLDYKFIVFSVVIAIASACIAAIIPARKSSKLNPIEVIKNG